MAHHSNKKICRQGGFTILHAVGVMLLAGMIGAGFNSLVIPHMTTGVVTADIERAGLAAESFRSVLRSEYAESQDLWEVLEKFEGKTVSLGDAGTVTPHFTASWRRLGSTSAISMPAVTDKCRFVAVRNSKISEVTSNNGLSGLPSEINDYYDLLLALKPSSSKWTYGWIGNQQGTEGKINITIPYADDSAVPFLNALDSRSGSYVPLILFDNDGKAVKIINRDRSFGKNGKSITFSSSDVTATAAANKTINDYSWNIALGKQVRADLTITLPDGTETSRSIYFLGDIGTSRKIDLSSFADNAGRLVDTMEALEGNKGHSGQGPREDIYKEKLKWMPSWLIDIDIQTYLSLTNHFLSSSEDASCFCYSYSLLTKSVDNISNAKHVVFWDYIKDKYLGFLSLDRLFLDESAYRLGQEKHWIFGYEYYPRLAVDTGADFALDSTNTGYKEKNVLIKLLADTAEYVNEGIKVDLDELGYFRIEKEKENIPPNINDKNKSSQELNYFASNTSKEKSNIYLTYEYLSSDEMKTKYSSSNNNKHIFVIRYSLKDHNYSIACCTVETNGSGNDAFLSVNYDSDLKGKITPNGSNANKIEAWAEKLYDINTAIEEKNIPLTDKEKLIAAAEGVFTKGKK